MMICVKTAKQQAQNVGSRVWQAVKKGLSPRLVGRGCLFFEPKRLTVLHKKTLQEVYRYYRGNGIRHDRG